MAFVWVLGGSSARALVAASRSYVDALEVGANASRAWGLAIAFEMFAPLCSRSEQPELANFWSIMQRCRGNKWLDGWFVSVLFLGSFMR